MASPDRRGNFRRLGSELLVLGEREYPKRTVRTDVGHRRSRVDAGRGCPIPSHALYLPNRDPRGSVSVGRQGPIAQLVERLAGSPKGPSGVRLDVSAGRTFRGTTKVMRSTHGPTPCSTSRLLSQGGEDSAKTSGRPVKESLGVGRAPSPTPIGVRRYV